MCDELIKALRNMSKMGTKYEVAVIKMREAADAIEGLSREAEEYKAAYRKEHNKRIAENRYLYDELTKTMREKLLMTPMRIEVPEPPKEEEE